jgi:hypothetical protein
MSSLISALPSLGRILFTAWVGSMNPAVSRPPLVAEAHDCSAWRRRIGHNDAQLEPTKRIRVFAMDRSRRLPLPWLRCRSCCGSRSHENLTRSMIDRVQLTPDVIGVNALALRQPLGEIPQQANDLLSMQAASACSRVHREAVLCLTHSLLCPRGVHTLRTIKTTNRITTSVPIKP